MVTEFFDETKVPMLFLDIYAYLENLGITQLMSFDPNRPMPVTKSGKTVDTLQDTMLAGYRLVGRLNVVPAKGEVDFPPLEGGSEFIPKWFPEYVLH